MIKDVPTGSDAIAPMIISRSAADSGSKLGQEPAVRTPRRMSTFGAAVLTVTLLGMFAGAASADNHTIGRGFTGVVQSVSTTNGLLVVESDGTLFQLAVTAETVINVLPDRDVGLEGLPAKLGFRVAGLVDGDITDAAGNALPEIRTALKITVIPEASTRAHKRTITSAKQGDDLTALDVDGGKTQLAGLGDGIAKGDPVIILVQGPGPNGQTGAVRGLFRAKVIDDRLDRMSESESGDPIKASILIGLRDERDRELETRLRKTAENAGANDRGIVLSRVRTIREDQAAREKKYGVISDAYECAASILGHQPTSIDELDNGERERLTAECLTARPRTPKPAARPAVDAPPVITITSPVPGTAVGPSDAVTFTVTAKDDLGVAYVKFNVAGNDIATLTRPPYSVNVLVPIKAPLLTLTATAEDTGGNEASASITLKVVRPSDLGVTITSPAATVAATGDGAPTSRPSTVSGVSRAIAEGDTIIIRADVTGTGVIKIVFRINGAAQTPISRHPYIMEYLVPYTSKENPPPLNITASATDGSGKAVSDSVTVATVRNVTTVNAKIVSPTAGSKVNGGDTIAIRAETDDDSKIAFVIFTVDGETTETTTAPFTHSYVVPRRSGWAAARSDVPPNVFVGKATLDGAPAPDGTVVTAWMSGADATSLDIKVTATADSGEIDSASVSLLVSSSINAGQGTVAKGEYVLTASQPAGQSFAGKTITFSIGGTDARQTGTWQQGGATILDLTAG